MARQPCSDLCLFIVKVSRSHSDTPHSVRLLWTSDRHVAETPIRNTRHTQETSIPKAGFEPAIPASGHPQTHALDRAATGISTYSVYTNVTVKAAINTIPLLTLLNWEFACRWPKAETSCDYVNKQPIYNADGVTSLLSYSLRRTAQGFVRYHQKYT